jgi:hypothetical protein
VDNLINYYIVGYMNFPPNYNGGKLYSILGREKSNTGLIASNALLFYAFLFNYQKRKERRGIG